MQNGCQVWNEIETEMKIPALDSVDTFIIPEGKPILKFHYVCYPENREHKDFLIAMKLQGSMKF